MNKKYIFLLSLGHLLNDFNQGAIPALLPFLIIKLQLNYAEAAGLVFATSAISSVVQPVLGYFSDKLSKPWMMPIGIFFAGAAMSLVGLLSEYHMIFLTVAISGFGVAAFHPEAVRFANLVSGENKATGISLFAIGGNAGFALGPLVTTALMLKFGLKSTLVFAIPSTIMTLILMFQLNSLSAFKNEDTEVSKDVACQEKDEWLPFARLSVIVVCRSIIFCCLNTFIPLYWITVLGQSESAGSTALTILIGTGIVGNIIGGRLSDRFGNRKIIRLSFAVLVPCLILFFLIKNHLITTALLCPIGFTLLAVYSPIILMAQEYLPKRMGLASGVTMGIAVSVGGMVAPLIGRLADLHGLQTALYLVAVFPVIALITSFTLSHPKSHIKLSA